MSTAHHGTARRCWRCLQNSACEIWAPDTGVVCSAELTARSRSKRHASAIPFAFVSVYLHPLLLRLVFSYLEMFSVWLWSILGPWLSSLRGLRPRNRVNAWLKPKPPRKPVDKEKLGICWQMRADASRYSRRTASSLLAAQRRNFRVVKLGHPCRPSRPIRKASLKDAGKNLATQRRTCSAKELSC